MENEYRGQKYALTLAEDGRILQVTYEQYANDKMVLVDEIPSGNTYEYRYVNGEYIHNPLPVPEAKPSDADRIAELEEALALLLSGVTE